MYQEFRREDVGALVKEEPSEKCAPVASSTIYDDLLQNHNDTYACKEETEDNPEAEGGQYKLLNVHNLSEKKYFCRACSIAFGTPSSLAAHLRCHKESELHMCNLCPESFPSMLDIREHMSGHSTQTWFHCPLCICSFSSEAWLQRHNVNIHDANVSPSVSDKYHQHQHALGEVACTKYATAEFPNPQGLLLKREIVDRPECKRSPERQDCNEALLESKPSSRCANGPATRSIDVCACGDKSGASCTPQNCCEITLQRKHLSDTLPYHSSEGDTLHLTAILPDDPQEASRETDIFNTGLSEGTRKERKTSNRKCIRGNGVPLKLYDSDHHQGLLGEVATSARYYSFGKSPDGHIIHRPAGVRGGDVQSESDERPYASNTTSNLREHVRGTRVKEKPATAPNARPPVQPVSSRKRKPHEKYLCPHCGEEFNHKSTFGSHVATHSAAKPFPCTVCSRTFPHQNSLNGHCWIHAIESLAHQESDCPSTHHAARATKPSTFVRNSQRDHVRELTDTEAVATCLVPAEGAAGENHSQRVLFQGEQPTFATTDFPVTAAKGGKAVKEQDSSFGYLPASSKKEKSENSSPQDDIQVKEEVQAIPEERPRRRFNCHLCPRDFSQKGSLRDHLRSHGGDKSYECHLCPQTFFYLSNLRRHVRCHSGEKWFACGHCGRQFSRRGSLRYHISRIHCSPLPAATGRAKSVP